MATAEASLLGTWSWSHEEIIAVQKEKLSLDQLIIVLFFILS